MSMNTKHLPLPQALLLARAQHGLDQANDRVRDKTLNPARNHDPQSSDHVSPFLADPITEDERCALAANLERRMSAGYAKEPIREDLRRDNTGPFRALAIVWALTLAVLACMWAVYSCSTAPETQPVMELR